MLREIVSAKELGARDVAKRKKWGGAREFF